MEPDTDLQKQIGIVLSIIIIVVVFGVTVFADRGPANITTTDQSSSASDMVAQSTQPPTTMPTPVKKVTSAPPADSPKKVTSVYKDGNYSATGSYMSPGGEEEILVALTLKNDIITAVSVAPEAEGNTSARYQNKFVSGYKIYVIGKNIADVNLGKISGSSLTPIGFDNALAQIKAQAKA